MNSERSKELQELVDVLIERNLTEIEVERAGVRIRVRRDASPPSRSSRPPAGPADSGTNHPPEGTVDSVGEDASALFTVTSPIVGTFYRSASPDADPFVEEGDVVSRGQVLCIVEAMKFMNEIEAETDGRIVQALVANGATVEYGQPLFIIDPHPVT